MTVVREMTDAQYSTRGMTKLKGVKTRSGVWSWRKNVSAGSGTQNTAVSIWKSLDNHDGNMMRRIISIVKNTGMFNEF